MKILHYVKQFSPLSETFVYNLIVDLQARGVQNYVATHKRVNSDSRPYSPVFILPEETAFLKRELFRMLRKVGLPKYGLKDEAWEEILQKTSPDLIHCHFGKSGYYASHVLEKLKLDIPMVISFHGTDVLSTPKKDKWYRCQLKKVSEKRNVFITTPTKFLKNAAKENFNIEGNKIIVNPNGFHLDFEKFYREKNPNDDDCFKIINIARFVQWKGHDYLLKAFRLFTENVTPNARLTLIGYGELKTPLISLIEDLGLTQKVDILEAVPHREIPEILKQHDLYIQPSITDHKSNQAESFGVTILEAVAVGLPVIVTDSGGMQEVVLGGDQKTAFVVAEKDSEELYAAISHVYHSARNIDPELRRKILSCFNQDSNSSAIIRLYERLLGNR